jgi:O-antigen/teichoic acid export membrane protein
MFTSKVSEAETKDDPTPTNSRGGEEIEVAPFVLFDPSLSHTGPDVSPTHPHADPEAGSAGVKPGSLLWRIRHVFGIDRAIAFSVMARGWSSLAGVGTILLIARFLSPAEQGYYYGFYSLVALQIVFELGFSVVILQTASHEAAHLRIAPDGSITGPEREHSRLASVLKKSVRWYTIGSILMGVTLIPVGVAFFRHIETKADSGGVHFVMPWLLVVIASSLTFQIDPIFSFLEGCGYVPEVSRTRLRQSILATVLGWSVFLIHRGLFAPGMFILGQAIAGAWFIFTKRSLLIPLLRHATEMYSIDWGMEIWPFQWRIAVSWMAGYISSQLFVPALANFRGAIEAGQMGMSLTICGVLTTMCVAWMNTKASPFGQMISRKEYNKLDQIFFRTLIQSTLLALVACLVVWSMVDWIAVKHIQMHHTLLASRLLAPFPLAMLLLGTIANIVIIAEAIYLRAHKQEKFMINSLVGAAYVIPVVLFIARRQTPHGGAWGVTAAYAFGSLFIGLGPATYTFLKWRRIWHAPQPDVAPALQAAETR